MLCCCYYQKTASGSRGLYLLTWWRCYWCYVTIAAGCSIPQGVHRTCCLMSQVYIRQAVPCFRCTQNRLSRVHMYRKQAASCPNVYTRQVVPSLRCTQDRLSHVPRCMWAGCFMSKMFTQHVASCPKLYTRRIVPCPRCIWSTNCPLSQSVLKTDYPMSEECLVSQTVNKTNFLISDGVYKAHTPDFTRSLANAFTTSRTTGTDSAINWLQRMIQPWPGFLAIGPISSNKARSLPTTLKKISIYVLWNM